MTALTHFRPRNEAVAKKLLFVLTLVAAGITVLFAWLFPTSATRTGVNLTIIGCTVIVALVIWMVVVPAPPLWVWAAYPFTAIALIAVLDVSSSDAGVTAQVFLFFPVLYAGAQLRRLPAVLVCLAAVVAEFVVTALLLPVSTAAVDTSFVGAALATSAALLVLYGERTDDLIAQLERQAAVDPLTGLLTRRVLDRAATSALTSAGSDVGTALLLIDIDHFKRINDVHGHPAGDAVLQQAARILNRINRSTDIISRMGGDEIAVLLPGCSVEAAVGRATDILQAVRAHAFDVAGCSMAGEPEISKSLTLSVSIGLAHLPTHARDLRALYAAADTSLYEAKRNGRDQVGAVGAPVGYADPVGVTS
jgi:diguanylate cyclase (GGDEF)-like protein